jgi:hypothetical protein
MLTRLALLAAVLAAAQAVPQPRSLARGDVSGDACKAGVCGGSASYSVAPGMRFYSTFNVPGLPLNASAIENDITFFIYANIFFDGGPGQCADCRMNQFVPQLMLGQPLYASTGPPAYNPLWTTATTWIFAAQYFMELYPNGTAKAAAGQWYNCTERDVLWTEFSLDEAWVWTMRMGVVGDPSRTSTLVAPQPFMGLLASETTSWQEPAYGALQLVLGAVRHCPLRRHALPLLLLSVRHADLAGARAGGAQLPLADAVARRGVGHLPRAPQLHLF